MDSSIDRVSTLVLRHVERHQVIARSDLRRLIARRDREWFDVALNELVEAGKLNRVGGVIWGHGVGRPAFPRRPVHVSGETYARLLDFCDGSREDAERLADLAILRELTT